MRPIRLGVTKERVQVHSVQAIRLVALDCQYPQMRFFGGIQYIEGRIISEITTQLTEVIAAEWKYEGLGI